MNKTSCPTAPIGARNPALGQVRAGRPRADRGRHRRSDRARCRTKRARRGVCAHSDRHRPSRGLCRDEQFNGHQDRHAAARRAAVGHRRDPELIRDQACRPRRRRCATCPASASPRAKATANAGLPRQHSTADFFVDGVRDDVQYYRDLYNIERVEVLKGPNAMIFGRGGGGRRDQPRHQARRTGARARGHAAGRLLRPPARHRRHRPAAQRDRSPFASQRHVRELRQLPGRRGPRALRRSTRPSTFAASDRTTR